MALPPPLDSGGEGEGEALRPTTDEACRRARFFWGGVTVPRYLALCSAAPFSVSVPPKTITAVAAAHGLQWKEVLQPRLTRALRLRMRCISFDLYRFL